MVISGYQDLYELSRTEWSTLLRGHRREDGAPVLLVIPCHDPPLAAEVALLAHQYELLQQLALTGIPRAYDFFPPEKGCCLVLEDTGATPLHALLASRRLDLESFFPLALRLCAILAELHQRELLHQCLTPRSILVHPRTGEVSLIDLSFTARTSDGSAASLPLHLLRETLAYISPEQTGRMNRTTDYRTDFYSLGVLFYEFVTGVRPFRSDDALELIHWHLARNPAPPAEVDPAIPAPLAQIVMKLLAKTPEQRYQSALGLKHDLELCAREWTTKTSIAPFPLGRHDVSDRFLIPQQLYGREHEVADLLAVFDHVCTGPAALTLVSGYAGIGKTALVQELYKPIVRQRGAFISGKFDQFTRTAPYSALVQAFRGLIRQLLTESEERLAAWRARLSDALGATGGVLIEVIPEIELILGPQPAPPPLGPSEAQNRLQLVFQNFVGALAHREYPLVIFLDDLQWADAATLNLLLPLLTSLDIQFLLLLGAYRDNEVDASHPLEYALRGLEAAGATAHRLSLGPLQLTDLTLLIRDTLHREQSEVEPLARLVLQKTDGNPFFVIQFLRTLWQEKLLRFDHDRGHWTFHLESIADAAMTDNVIDLMTRKIQRLSSQTQRVLTLASCIGSRFDVHTLAVISQTAPDSVTSNLSEALREGLILAIARPYETPVAHDPRTTPPRISAYAFLHDRVQQAAYALIPDEQKQTVHLTVGRLLLRQDDPARIEEQLFDIAHHYNLGRNLITDQTERVSLARLNLRAGRKAKASAAYEAAFAHLAIALDLSSARGWDSDYDFAFTLHLEAAEGAYLCGRFDEAERDFDRLLARAQTNLDKAKVYYLKILHYEHTSRYTDAIQAARDGVALFGLSFPDSPEGKRAALEAELATIQTLMGDRAIESLVDLPVMTDPETRTVMRLLGNLHTSCFLSGDKPLTLLNIAMMIRLSLTHGNIEESAYAYVLRAAMLDGPIREDYRAGYEFGLLALRLNERLYDPALRAKILMTFAWSVSHWRRPLEESFPHTREAFRLGNETGLFVDAAWALFNEIWFAMLTTGDLVEFHETYAPNVGYSERIKMGHIADGKRVLLQWGQALRGLTKHPCAFSDAVFDEEEYCRTYGGMRLFQMFHAALKLSLLYTFADYRAAGEEARRAERIIRADFTGTIWDEIRTFYHLLTLTALHPAGTGQGQPCGGVEMETLNARLRKWAENSPANFQAQYLIASAEIARVRGREAEAATFYEAAIEAAAHYRRQREQALANELYAKFRRDRGQEQLAAIFFAEARDAYAHWGAAAKARDLEQRYAELLRAHGKIPPAPRAEVSGSGSTSVTGTGPETSALDVASVLKAAQALAGEIDLEKLLERLLRVVLENAGAERGSLILERDGEAFVLAEASLEVVDVKARGAIPLSAMQTLPTGLVQYVRRTHENVVLADASTDGRYAADPYIIRCRPRSVLCIPVLNQGRLVGVLYVENNLATGAFTEERINLMRLIAAEAAVSLENARLYDEMKQEAAQRQQAEEMLRTVTEGTAAVTGADFFSSLVRHLALALQVRYAFVTKCTDKKRTRVRTIAFWAEERFVENIEYDVAETPCLGVMQGMVCFHARDVQTLFPQDQDLVSLNAASYLGVPILNTTNEVIGHLVILDTEPLQDDDRRTAVLRIFAARAGAELERQQAEERVRAALAEVETLKDRLEAENVYLQEEIRTQHNFEEMVGNSPALLDVLRKVEMVAPTDAAVLILGETGVGKELIARAIHSRSSRKDRPLVKVNCGAISAGLVESELFGHVKGAFTGAIENRVGRFELAHGGTLFLDEVGELPLETQVKLLRVLQEQEFEPVGSSRAVRVDVRIITATNRDLEEAVRAGRFRSDLFYRLHVFPLHAPPLRERRSDIPQLAMFFLTRFARQFGKKIETIGKDTMELLLNYAWPGNIRELQNLVERAVVLCQGPILTIDATLLPRATSEAAPSPALAEQRAVLERRAPPPAAEPPPSTEALSLEEMERRHIISVLRQTGGVIEGAKGAALLLNLHPNTLRSRMKKLGVKRADFALPAADPRRTVA